MRCRTAPARSASSTASTATPASAGIGTDSGGSASDIHGRDLVPAVTALLSTVANEARCYLASQHQTVVSSVFERFPDEPSAHASGRAAGVDPELVAEVVDISDGVAVLDQRHRDKQPDWTYGAEYSGKAPADLMDEHRSHRP